LFLAGVPSSAEPFNKLEMVHFDVEHHSVRKSETADADSLISFNPDDCLDERVLYYSIDSRVSCNAGINNVVNTGQQPQDGNFSPTMEPVESICSNSSTEVVYYEILDVSVRNQIASDFSSQENQLLDQSSQSNGVLEFGKVENSGHTELGQVRDW